MQSKLIQIKETYSTDQYLNSNSIALYKQRIQVNISPKSFQGKQLRNYFYIPFVRLKDILYEGNEDNLILNPIFAPLGNQPLLVPHPTSFLNTLRFSNIYATEEEFCNKSIPKEEYYISFALVICDTNFFMFWTRVTMSQVLNISRALWVICRGSNPNLTLPLIRIKMSTSIQAGS